MVTEYLNEISRTDMYTDKIYTLRNGFFIVFQFVIVFVCLFVSCFCFVFFFQNCVLKECNRVYNVSHFAFKAIKYTSARDKQDFYNKTKSKLVTIYKVMVIL